MTILSLGLIRPDAQLTWWVATELYRHAAPAVQRLITDPAGMIGRLGDLFVWTGPSGRRVLAGLEGAAENHARVAQAVGHIEAAQFGLAKGVVTLTHLSMATLGATSLAAGFLGWRLKARDSRLIAVGRQIGDIRALIDAEQKALIQTALDHLHKYEQESSSGDLTAAQTKSFEATNLYRNLVEDELAGPRRPVALNQTGRYYLLALMAQIRSLVLGGSLALAEERIETESVVLTALAHAFYDAVLGAAPEVYLDPRLQPDGITLDLLAELYRQARLAGVAVPGEFADAGGTFEHLRPRVAAARIPTVKMLKPLRQVKARLLAGLKYLAACLGDVNRVFALRLRIAAAREGNYSLRDLERDVATARAEAVATGGGGGGDVFAYAFD
jgi:hypothetical protein